MKRHRFKRLRRRAHLLLKQNGKCCYCGVRLRLLTLKPGQPAPDDACTIEHPYPKGDPRRVPHGSYKVKLACRRCNNDRGNKPIEEFLGDHADASPRGALRSAAE